MTTALIKAAGPVVVGGRKLPAWFMCVVALLAPTLSAALTAAVAALLRALT